MNIFYLDSSAWVKRHQEEAGSDWMARLWQPSVHFAYASLGLVEVLCTIARRHAANNVNQASTDSVLKAVRQDFAGFLRIEFDNAVLTLAESLASTRRLRGADCIHLASAMHMRDSLGVTVALIASDAELLAAASAEGFSTLNPVLDTPLPPP
jgi:predicted nucleic acid-binding protein